MFYANFEMKTRSGELGASLSTSGINYFSAITCRHARTEAMRSGSFDTTWLKCTFHCSSPVNSFPVQATAPEKKTRNYLLYQKKVNRLQGFR